MFQVLAVNERSWLEPAVPSALFTVTSVLLLATRTFTPSEGLAASFTLYVPLPPSVSDSAPAGLTVIPGATSGTHSE